MVGRWPTVAVRLVPPPTGVKDPPYQHRGPRKDQIAFYLASSLRPIPSREVSAAVLRSLNVQDGRHPW